MSTVPYLICPIHPTQPKNNNGPDAIKHQARYHHSSQKSTQSPLMR